MITSQLLEGIIKFIGIVYILILLSGTPNSKEFILITVTAFVMVITVLLLGKFLFGVF